MKSPGAPTSLLAVLGVTWLNSVATGTMLHGVFFIASSAYGFAGAENALLGLVMGLAYIPGAIGVGPALRRLTERVPWLSTRDVLLGLMAGSAIIDTAPWLAGDRAWVIWPVIIAFNLCNGATWPIVEAYLSGARRGDALRTATAKFNVSWATAIVVAAWFMAPLLEERPLVILALIGATQLAACVFLVGFPAEPPRHLHEEHPHPPIYVPLLHVFRWLLLTSYVLQYCLNPMLPDLIEGLGVPLQWAPPLASTWTFVRVGSFLLFAFWGGWHGRRRTPVWTAACAVAGFVVAVLAPSVPVMILGLALFGMGMGGIYAAALYYALAVGAAEVDAGGKHEALIGTGYTLGPVAALGGFALADAANEAGDLAGQLSPRDWTLILAGLLVLGGLAGAVMGVRRAHRDGWAGPAQSR